MPHYRAWRARFIDIPAKKRRSECPLWVNSGHPACVRFAPKADVPSGLRRQVYGFHKVSSFRPCRQVTMTVALEASTSALASRIAEATADVFFFRAEMSVAAPLRNTSHACAGSFQVTRYSTAAIFRESRLRPSFAKVF